MKEAASFHLYRSIRLRARKLPRWSESESLSRTAGETSSERVRGSQAFKFELKKFLRYPDALPEKSHGHLPRDQLLVHGKSSARLESRPESPVIVSGVFRLTICDPNCESFFNTIAPETIIPQAFHGRDSCHSDNSQRTENSSRGWY